MSTPLAFTAEETSSVSSVDLHLFADHPSHSCAAIHSFCSYGCARTPILANAYYPHEDGGTVPSSTLFVVSDLLWMKGRMESVPFHLPVILHPGVPTRLVSIQIRKKTGWRGRREEQPPPKPI